MQEMLKLSFENCATFYIMSSESIMRHVFSRFRS